MHVAIVFPFDQPIGIPKSIFIVAFEGFRAIPTTIERDLEPEHSNEG